MKKIKIFNKEIPVLLIIVTLSLVTVGIIAGVKKAGACGAWWGCSSANSFTNESAAIEQNQQRLVQAQPLPKMSNSQERKNLIRRLNTFNNENKISYIALISFDGKVIKQDTVKGKVSSVDSSLTAQVQLLDADGHPVTEDNSCGHYGCFPVPAPAADGSYGTNGNAIFYYTENGTYREWNGQYILSDQPINF